jgi:hypothetical protein
LRRDGLRRIINLLKLKNLHLVDPKFVWSSISYPVIVASMEGVVQTPDDRPERLLTGDHQENPNMNATDMMAQQTDGSGVVPEKFNFSEGFDVRYLRTASTASEVPDEERRMRGKLLSARMYKELHGKDAGKCWFCFGTVHPDKPYGTEDRKMEWSQLLKQPSEKTMAAYPETIECPWYQFYLAVLQSFCAEPLHEQDVRIELCSWSSETAPSADVLGRTCLDRGDANSRVSRLRFSGSGWGDLNWSYREIYSSPGQYKPQHHAGLQLYSHHDA